MSTPLLENILNQADALQAILSYQFGEGSAALERAAELLQSRKRIVLTGMGASFFACIPLQHMLARQGFDVTCVETAELLYFRSSPLNRETVVVLVSRSGESIEIIRQLPILRDSGALILGVVNVPGSTLSKEANHSLLLGSPADQLVAIQTYTATLAVFALLSAAVHQQLDRAKTELAATIELLAKTIPAWVKDREQLRPFLDDASPLYLIGRGAALGAVSEGVLLMHEVAKSAAVGMSVPQFRHGPVEAVDPHFHAIVIGTQVETADLDSAFAGDLSHLGAQVRWLGPVTGGNTHPLCSWPTNIPEQFGPIFETIPLQLAAYVKAELRGLRPGDFRWAPAVTSSETGFLSGTESNGPRPQ